MLRDSKNEKYILKVVKKDHGSKGSPAFYKVSQERALARLESEWKILFPELRERGRKVGLKVPTVYAHGKDYLLREVAPGVSGETWVDEWQKGGYDPEFRVTLKFYESSEN